MNNLAKCTSQVWSQVQKWENVDFRLNKCSQCTCTYLDTETTENLEKNIKTVDENSTSKNNNNILYLFWCIFT